MNNKALMKIIEQYVYKEEKIMIGKTPPMGWNTWNTFADKISAELIMESADYMISEGLRDAGYEYVVVDDFWMSLERNDMGELVPDPEKFPEGIEKVIDYVHKKGLKFGIYSCCGTLTCGSCPGSFQHEFTDAETFARWGIDFLKYDNCHKPDGIDDCLLYRRMALALRSCGREILFSACSWGEYDTLDWARTSGAHMWRSTGDIMDSWDSIKQIAMSQFENAPYNAPYSFNDMDMLTVGIRGKSHIGLKGCTDDEYQTHFALWALMSSPLMIGCDIRNMDEITKKILTNKELIDINQDIEGRQAYAIKIHKDTEFYALVKPLSGGEYAFGLFNFSEDDCYVKNRLSLKFWDIGFPYSDNYGFELRDVINHKDIGIRKEMITTELAAHSCAVYRGKLVKIR